MLSRIRWDSHLNAVVATGNATLYLVAFLSTDNGTPKPVRHKETTENDFGTYRATADHLFSVNIRLSEQEIEGLRIWGLHDLDAV